MSGNNSASQRLLDDCISSKLDVKCDESTLKKFLYKFCDLTHNGAVDFGQNLLDKCIEFSLSNSEDSATIFGQLCFIVDFYFDSIDYVRYANFLSSFVKFFYENLSKMVEKLSESPRLSIVFSILCLKCVKFKQFCDFYDLTSDNQNLKSIVKTGHKNLAPSIDKRLLQFSKLILSPSTKSAEILDDYNLDHVCEPDICHDRFCMDAYRIKCFVDNLSTIRNLIFLADSRTRKLFEFCLKSTNVALKRKVVDFLICSEDFRSLIGIFFEFGADFVEQAFVFGSDVGLWFRNFYATNIEPDLGTARKILRKFFRHFVKNSDAWRGDVQNLDIFRSFHAFLDFQRNLRYAALDEASKFMLFSLNSILLIILDMSKFEGDMKNLLILKIAHILLFLAQETDFLIEFDAVLQKLFDLRLNVAVFNRILAKIDSPLYEKLLDRLSMDQAVENYPFIVEFLKIGIQFEQCRKKIDNFVCDILKHEKKRWTIVLPHFLPIFGAKYSASPKLFEKICKHTVESMVGENFLPYFIFVAENFARVSDVETNLKQILLSNLKISPSDVLRQNLEILGSSTAKILGHLAPEDVQFIFEELEYDKTLLILDVFVNCVEFLPEEQEFTKSLKRLVSNTLKSAPLHVTLQSTNLLDILQLCNDLSKEKRKVRFLNVKVVNLILGILCAVNYKSLAVENLHIFKLICNILRQLLKPRSTYVVNSAHIFLQIWINVQKALINLVYDQPHNRQISDFVSQFSSLLIFGAKKFSVDFCKIAPYLIAEFVQNLKNRPLKKRQLDNFLPYIYEFLDICDKYASAMLATNLDDGSKEVFRMVFDEYTKFHKFKMFV